MNIFDEIKNTVSMPDLVSHYGFKPNRAGFIHCPFHSEKTASLKVYQDSFHCYGCGAGGSQIDFVMLLCNLSPLEAARKIADDMRLDIDGEPDLNFHHARELKESFDPYVENLKSLLCAIIFAANTFETFDDLTEAEAKVLKYREIAQYKLDILNNGSIKEIISIVEGREEVEALCSSAIMQRMRTQ